MGHLYDSKYFAHQSVHRTFFWRLPPPRYKNPSDAHQHNATHSVCHIGALPSVCCVALILSIHFLLLGPFRLNLQLRDVSKMIIPISFCFDCFTQVRRSCWATRAERNWTAIVSLALCATRKATLASAPSAASGAPLKSALQRMHGRRHDAVREAIAQRRATGSVSTASASARGSS